MTYFKNMLFFSVIMASLLVGGCVKSTNPFDPYESFNRRVFKVNAKFDKYLLAPTAHAYIKLTPWPLRTGINNFFNNLYEVQTVASAVLQVKPKVVLISSWRFAVNSTFGLAGLLDVASRIGLERQYQDLGLTFAYYGDVNSPYFVRPLTGPSTFRDAFANIYDNYLVGPFAFYTPKYYRWIAPSIYAVSLRANLMANEQVMQSAALDPYVFQRDAYLQYRNGLIAANRLGNHVPTAATAIPHDDGDLLPADEDEKIAPKPAS